MLNTECNTNVSLHQTNIPPENLYAGGINSIFWCEWGVEGEGGMAENSDFFKRILVISD